MTGYQWKWQYEYVDHGVSFFSTLARSSDVARQLDSGIAPGERRANYLLEVDNPLVVPQGRKVRVLITANDVIHAWWVPDFGMKKRRDPRLHQRDCGSTPTRPAPTAASAPNCAAATTASCRWWSR